MSFVRLASWLRAGQHDLRDIRVDLFWLCALTLLFVATGIGLRDPWPADEPRFALIARDMVASGDWLVPRVGGDLYADKPPLYFWLIALALQATDSLRSAFLLPSLLSALGCVLLVYDLARRLWNRETGLIAATTLLLTVQFVWQARQAQIDATLCFWTTLSLYGLMRHALAGPRWGWYTIGWAAAGFGVITKGVGFLPLLMLPPLSWLQWRWHRERFAFDARLLFGPLAFLVAISVWLAPMLIATSADPALQAYRDEILFKQTIERYADAWHHLKPFWYFIVTVIPGLWLPMIALVPWLIPKWRDAWRAHDVRIASLLIWCAIVVLFFSASPGKRGVYVLPAVPAFVLACAPYIVDLARQKAVARVVYAVTVALAVVCAAGVIYVASQPHIRTEFEISYGIDPFGPLLTIALATAIASLAAGSRRSFLAFGSTLASILLVVSFWINPALNDVRSGRDFVQRLQYASDARHELGIVAFKEQYLLYVPRPIVHFGHARFLQAEQEASDAARWLADGVERQLVVDEKAKDLCFSDAVLTALGKANRREWFLVRGGAADSACVQRGDPRAAIKYVPPGAHEAHTPSVDLLSRDDAHELRADPRTVRAERISEHRE